MRLRVGLGSMGAALLLAVALLLADGGGWMSGAGTAAAQGASSSGRKAASKRPAAKAKSKDTATDTDRQLDAAAKSLADGNADAAMTVLDGILAGGGLANNHMARALYLRGVAHRKKSRPAQAIADLTSAVWLKDGLSGADRTAALKERSEVSREVGVADAGAPRSAAPAVSAPVVSQAPAAQTGLVRRPPPVGQPGLTEGGFPRIVATAPPRAVPEPPAPQAPAAQPSVVRRAPPIGGPGLTEAGFPRVAATAPPGTPPVTSPPPRASGSSDSIVQNGGKATSSWQSGTSVGTPDGWVSLEERQKSRAAAPAPDGSSGSGGGLGEFFSGLFGLAPSSSPPARTTKSADSPPWSTSIQGATARRTTEKPRERSVAVVTSATPPAKAARGAYRLQIAAVRSRTEAEAVAARVRKDHGRVIGGRKLEVDETVFGNMGTFYRVRLGPFAAAGESKVLCDQLRTKGFDCLVVTQ